MLGCPRRRIGVPVSPTLITATAAQDGFRRNTRFHEDSGCSWLLLVAVGCCWSDVTQGLGGLGDWYTSSLLACANVSQAWFTYHLVSPRFYL